MKSFFASVLAAIVFVAAPVHGNELEDGATQFIQALEQDAISSLTDPDKARDARVTAFRTLFNEKFAVQVIGRWTLGRNWRRASEDEQQEFMKLFEDLMVATYVDRFANYSGETLTLLKTVPVDENRATVHTEMARPGAVDAKPISILWRVGRQGDIFKVLDVVVEGASMSITLQREFAAIIKNTGSVAGLLEELRKKTAEMNPT